jgi:3-phenylpropionate/trans-cinnamate dioxygenase ferredoxin subunit
MTQSGDEQTDTFVVGPVDDLEDGQMRVFPDVGDYGVVLCKVQGELYAIDDNCSHADTPLSEGRLRGSTITCPLHGACFDVRDGSHTSPPAWEGGGCYSVATNDTQVILTRQSAPLDRGGFSGAGGPLQTR